jgi:hypothetical protein
MLPRREVFQALPERAKKSADEGAGNVRDCSRVHLVVPPGGSFPETRRIELGPRVLSVGRGAQCDVRIDVPGVDDEHAKISEVAVVAVGADCAVGDVPLDAGHRRLLGPGDEVQIGSVVLAIEGQDPSADPHPRVPRVRVVEGQNFGDELALLDEGREYVIGRSPKVDLVLGDREVSREHIKVLRRGASVLLFDAASTRGSWLGRANVYQGSRVEWQAPRMLKLGATVLALVLPDEVRARAPGAKASAPMTPPPRVKRVERAALAGAAAAEGPAPVPVYHYEAKPQPHAAPAPQAHATPAAFVVPVSPSVPAPAITPSVAPANAGPRKAWKGTGPTVGRGLGILLLALAGLAILGALFLVFSLME